MLLHYLNFAIFLCGLSFVFSCPCKDASFCKPVKNIPSKEIYVFLRAVEPKQLSMFAWDKITTIAVSDSYEHLPELMCYAHERNVRVVPLVDFGPKKDLADPSKRKTWIDQKSELIARNYLDGINIDLEASISSSEKAIVDGYTSLVRETKLALRKSNPYAQISIDVESSPLDPNRGYDYKALGQICDFFFVMDYDEGYTQPISANSGFYKSKLGLMAFISGGIPAHKLVMGLPWYGYGFKCKKVKKNYCYRTFGYQDGYSTRTRSLRSVVAEFDQKSEGDITLYCYCDIVPILNSSASFGRQWNGQSLTPYFFYKDQSSQIYQMQYDDKASLWIKSTLAVKMRLKGVGVFISDCLDFSDTPEAKYQRQQLWSSLPAYK